MIWYTVYLTDTDEIVASGTAQECIKALGMTRNSFYSTVSKAALSQRHKYTFFKEDIKKGGPTAMTFTLTINGESAAELLTALQQLNTTPLEKSQSKPAKAPAKQQRPAPAAPEKPAAAPAAAPAENPVPAPAEQPEPVAEQQSAEPEKTDAPAITPEQQLTKIRDLARSLIAAGKSKEVQKVINSTGARMVSKIPEDSYTAVWEQLCKIKEELDAAD